MPNDMFGYNPDTETITVDKDTVYLMVKLQHNTILSSAVYHGPDVPEVPKAIAVGAMALWDSDPDILYQAALDMYGSTEGEDTDGPPIPDYGGRTTS